MSATRFILSVLLLVALTGGPESFAQATDAPAVARREAQLKAAYLLNFLRFVEWPAPAPDAALQVCFAGGRTVHDVLAEDQKPRRAADGRLLQIRWLALNGSGAEWETCDAVFLEASAGNAAVADAMNEVRRRRFVLTVSDLAGFAARGGVIELFREDSRLRFTVNMDNARSAGLRVGSALLQLASAVQGGGP